MKKLLALLLLVPNLAFGQGWGEGTFPFSTTAFGSVTASYTTFLANTKSLVDLDIYNGTDASITCTNDTATAGEGWVIPSYSAYSPKLASATRYLNGNISCKRTSGAPTVGSVEISGTY